MASTCSRAAGQEPVQGQDKGSGGGSQPLRRHDPLQFTDSIPSLRKCFRIYQNSGRPLQLSLGQ